VGGDAPFHAYQVLLFDFGVFCNKLSRYPTVLCQNQQTLGIDIETPRRGQAAQMRRVEAHWRSPGVVLVGSGNERGRWPVSPFGLVRHITHRLVQQDGYPFGLALASLSVESDLLVGVGFAPQF